MLATIRKYITSQNVVPRKEVALVKTSYGFKLKQYAPRLLDKVEHKAASINDLILDSTVLPMPEIATEENLRQIRIAKRLIRRKRWLYDIQNQPFSDMETDDALAEYLDNATFVNKDGEVCEFTTVAETRLEPCASEAICSAQLAARLRQDRSGISQSQISAQIWQGTQCGDTCPCHCHQYDLDSPFLAINKERYRVIRTYKDLEDVPRGIFLLLSTSMVGKLKRDLMRFVKLSSRKLCLVFDESDEITNPSSQRTKHILAVFRRPQIQNSRYGNDHP